MIRRFFTSVREWLEFIDALGQLAMIVVLWFYILYLMRPLLSPLLTIVFCLTMTAVGLGGDRLSRAMTICGLVTYGSGWVVALFAGPIVGTLICGAGVVIWFIGALRTFFPSATRHSLVPA